MLEEVVVIICVEEGLDSIWTWTVACKRNFRNPQKMVNNSLLHQ